MSSINKKPRWLLQIVCLLIFAGAFLTAARFPSPIPPTSAPPEEEWTLLFNGQDFSGWETWLSRAPGERQVLGLNNDPLDVFSVEDGAIHISGQVFGALTTVEEYGNYHLRMEQKWGNKKWPPRLERARDSGICYHGTGSHGAFAGSWMRSFQFQIGEASTGEFWPVAGSIADVEAVREDDEWRYRPGAEKVTISKGHVLAAASSEKPDNDWNTVELIVRGDTAIHIVNGDTVMVLTNLRQIIDGAETPLTRGRIQLQSEGAEVWFRNVEIRPLPDEE